MTRIRKGREKDGEESRERSLSGKSLSGFGLQSSQQEELSRFINDKRNPDRERMTLSEEEVERKTCQGEKSFQTNSQQQGRLSTLRGVRSKPDQEKVTAPNKDVKITPA